MGVPDPGATADTVAVRVVDCPVTVGFTDEVNVVVVEAWFTAWLVCVEVEPEKFVSPL